jgi:hypothetical protein
MKKISFSVLIFILFCNHIFGLDHKNISFDNLSSDRFTLIENGEPVNILIDNNDNIGITLAATNLQNDFNKVSGKKPEILQYPSGKRLIIAGSLKSKVINDLVKKKKLDVSQLRGKNEKYILTTISNPYDNDGEALVIAGSDRRGTIYGIYELSEQIGVSPWYDWADVPVLKKNNLSITRGCYTAGEPAVKYRGIFLNDEAPCLTSWVKNTYGTNYGDHRFYARVFELILRLRGNYIWPAMWSWAFYQDDTLNLKTANDMGVVIGTSHHEPMARNHQEWTRKRKEHGKWDYETNSKIIDEFFRQGIERAKNTENIITIGMRGGGDQAMSPETNTELLKRIIKNQRTIIEKTTKKPANKTPQVWALYKEVLDYYDKGLRVPDDVIMLLCDDNWGNVRRLPNEQERKHPGGWGLYYHVDYVGAPRNYKWLNVTPIHGMWEQLQLTYDYGVDKLWVLNVGDLKPMEYPITLFMDMAWNPTRFNETNLLDHTRDFCAQQFGESHAEEAKRILNLYSKYNGRVTPEMMNATTYNLETGEWKNVADDYARLEAEALRLYLLIDNEHKDAYKQLILFPVQAMSNLYEMYYAQAMNHKLYAENDPAANEWADKVEQTFKRDAYLMNDYNNIMSGGKWKGMMIQKHIGYKSWDDNFRSDILPKINRVDSTANNGGYIFSHDNGYISIEAEHFFERIDSEQAKWTIIPDLGRTLSGVSLMPYSKPFNGASLSYKFTLPENIDSVKVHVIVKSTLAFSHLNGHEYKIGLKGGSEQVVNINSDLNENPENIYSIFYPTVARRIIEKVVKFKVSKTTDGTQLLRIEPLSPGLVFEKIVIDFGGYKNSYLFMNESHKKRF